MLKKKIICACAVTLAFAATSVIGFASTSYTTPAEAAAGITGKTVEEVYQQHQSGTTYGAIAAEAEKLDEFKLAMQDIYKNALDKQVTSDSMTQEQADAVLATKAERQAACDGSGNGSGGGGLGLGAGTGNNGGGLGLGAGNGKGGCRSAGHGMRNGTCIYE